jgi:hypothetical protein
MDSHLVVFKGQQVRRTLHNDEWWFVVEDVVLALIDSKDPKQYIQRMKQRDPELGKGWVQIVHTLSINTPGGVQKMICANTEGVFRIIQSIPSPKTEPFKRWLAKAGYERVQEIEDPELATITRKRDARGLDENKIAARKGGRIAGEAREKLEAETGTSVVSSENYLAVPEKTKRLKGKKS